LQFFSGGQFDLLFYQHNQKTLTHIKSFNEGTDTPSHHHEKISDQKACCGHIANSTSRKFQTREILLHPIWHTLKVFIFIFIISALIGIIFENIKQNVIVLQLLAQTRIFQPLAMVLLGLIPNCAASIAITKLYLAHAITYGAALAGLCASSGLGILILIREEKNKKMIVCHYLPSLLY